MDNQEKGYEVNDRRRLNMDDESAQQPADAPAEEDVIAEEPRNDAQEQHAHQEEPQLPDFDVYMLMEIMIGSFAEKAWECMGLRMAPGAKEIKKDIEQAKLAVDIVEFLVTKLTPRMNEEEKRATKQVVSDLKINFVRQSS